MKIFRSKILGQRKWFSNSKAGMTMAEMVVVVSIFATITVISVFNYSKFQDRVDIKNLANDVALKIIQGQKWSLAGKLPTQSVGSTWQPAYGVYFDSTTTTKFIYFVDADGVGGCNTAGCAPPYSVGGEVLEIINITKGNTIPSNGLEVVGTGTCPPTVTNLSVLYKRPSSSPTLTTNTSLSGCTVTYFAVNVTSPKGVTSKIRVYPFGRIQIS